MNMTTEELVLEEFVLEEAPEPLKTIVLQPSGNLSGTEAVVFQGRLAQAIEQSSGVIVDLLWVEEVDHSGVAALLAGVQQAKAFGKALSFLSMNSETRVSLDNSWEKQRDMDTLTQTDQFSPGFEQFLDYYRTQNNPE